MLCYAMLRFDMLYYAMMFYVILGYGRLCYVMPYYAGVRRSRWVSAVVEW